MAINKYIEQIFPIECSGRKSGGKKVFEDHVQIEVNVHKYKGSNMISSTVECKYNCGPHGERCAASGSDKDKSGRRIYCPYSFDHYNGI